MNKFSMFFFFFYIIQENIFVKRLIYMVIRFILNEVCRHIVIIKS